MKRPSSIALATSLSLDNNDAAMNPFPSKRRRFTIDSEWILRELPEMPYLYLKEKTATVVLNDSPQQIANRIVESARSMNCFGEYNSAKAKATLSVDDTEFYIQLFKVRVGEKQEKANECIIVEMQRLSGSTVVFHRVARNILSASKIRNVQVLSRVPVNTERSVTSHREGSTSTSTGSTTGTVKESDLFNRTMEIVESLLKKDRVDANLLGMESLQLLTNPNSSSDAMVAYASNITLTGCGFGDVKRTLVSLIADHTTFEGEAVEENSAEAKYFHKIRTCAFTVLSNALDAMRGTDAFEDQCLADEEWAGEDGFLSVLLKEMNQATSRPHDAYLAGKSIKTILENSSRMRSNVSQLEATRIILDAQTVGKGYPLLNNVSESLLEILGEAK